MVAITTLECAKYICMEPAVFWRDCKKQRVTRRSSITDRETASVLPPHQLQTLPAMAVSCADRPLNMEAQWVFPLFHRLLDKGTSAPTSPHWWELITFCKGLKQPTDKTQKNLEMGSESTELPEWALTLTYTSVNTLLRASQASNLISSSNCLMLHNPPPEWALTSANTSVNIHLRASRASNLISSNNCCIIRWKHHMF